MPHKSDERFDVYRTVTDSIITAVEGGAGTFVMPWHSGGAATARPENAYTKMPYHGINVVALWAQACGAGYTSGYWASYKQWLEVGAQVRKGERGAIVVFFKRLDDDAAETSESNEPPRPRLVARASRVFNAEQVAGWNPPMPPPVRAPVELMASVGTFVEATDAQISHGASGAWYDVHRDIIELPAPERFTGSPTCSASEAYHATLLHELVHWTGAPHRLDRGLAELGLATRAREELIAEIGAAFLCVDLQITNSPRPDHAAYVAAWLKLLRSDTRAVFHASRLASQAANYLHEIAARID